MSIAYSDLNAFVTNLVIPKTTDTIYGCSPVLTMLHAKNKERFSGGLQIQRPIIVGELNGGPFGRGEAFDVDYVKTDAAIVVDIRGYYVGISLYGWDSIQNQGPASAFSLVETKFQNASLKMAKLLGTNMYLDDQGARTKHLTGFKMWYDDGTNYPTIGGQTRNDIVTIGTIGGLNAYQATLAAFTLAQLNTAYGKAWFGQDHVDMISATQNGYDLIWQALQPYQRYTDKDTSLATAGFQSFRFNAAEVVVDQYLPTGTNGLMFGMNTKYIEWYMSDNKKFQLGFTGFKELPNSIDVAGQFLWAGNIVVPNPRSGFKLSGTML
jgi:hypothetical protein